MPTLSQVLNAHPREGGKTSRRASKCRLGRACRGHPALKDAIARLEAPLIIIALSGMDRRDKRGEGGGGKRKTAYFSAYGRRPSMP
jgi:hypothetical protein